jgi:Phage tail tube protein
MPVGIGASGILGLAVEVTPGTYVAPTKYVPINSESITIQQDTVWRRPIRQSADIVGAVPGNFHPEGDIQMESLEDVVVYFLYAFRTLVVKTGTTPNFTYTITPTAAAIPNKTLSLTVVRNGIVFGYTGMVTSSFTFGVEDGLLTFNVTVLGRDEASQSLPSPTWPTTTPFGAGTYTIEIPTSTPVLDTDTFEFTCEANPTAQFRLKNTGRGAQFINYGENNSTCTVERDFESRADYDLFKAVTAQSITLLASKGANNSISMLAPVAIKDTYEVGLSGQGDLVRASVAYQNVINSSGVAWTIVVKTQEDFTP